MIVGMETVPVVVMVTTLVVWVEGGGGGMPVLRLTEWVEEVVPLVVEGRDSEMEVELPVPCGLE